MIPRILSLLLTKWKTSWMRYETQDDEVRRGEARRGKVLRDKLLFVILDFGSHSVGSRPRGAALCVLESIM